MSDPVPPPDGPDWRRARLTPRQRVTDLAVAGGLLVATALSTALYGVAGVYPHPAPGWLTVLWMLAITVPLAVRRSHPLPSAIVVAVAFLVGGVAQVPELLMSNILLFLAIYSVGAWEPRRRAAALGRGLIVAGMLVWLVVSMYQHATDPRSLPDFSRAGAFSPLVAFLLIQVLTNVLYFSAAWFFGDRSWSSARERALLRYLAEELDRERLRSAEQAVGLERLRIARELHDVVAHHVSVMGVQAGAARTVIGSDPSAAAEALAVVEQTSRTAIDELHGLLFTLRDPEAPSAVAPGVADLPALVEASREAGVPAQYRVVGEPMPLPAGVEVNLYRIAQEALTNVRKHAGSDAAADVRLRYSGGAVELEVGSTGRVPARPSRRGLGLVGMRERAAASGGTLEAGPRSRGGYLVRATVPIPAGTEVPEGAEIPAGGVAP